MINNSNNCGQGKARLLLGRVHALNSRGLTGRSSLHHLAFFIDTALGNRPDCSCLCRIMRCTMTSSWCLSLLQDGVSGNTLVLYLKPAPDCMLG